VKLSANRASAALWVIAAAYFVAAVGSYVMTLPVGQIDPGVLFVDVLRAVIGALLTASQPAAFAILIQLIDQILRTLTTKP
jgi:hypothetical protein